MKILFLTNQPSPYRVTFFDFLGELCDLTVLFEQQSSLDRDQKWVSRSKGFYKGIFLNQKVVKEFSWPNFSVINYLKDTSYDIIIIGQYSTPTGMVAIHYLKRNKISFWLNSDGGIAKNDNIIHKIIKTYFISSAQKYLSTGTKTDEYLMHYGVQRDNIYHFPFTSIKKEDILTRILSDSDKAKIRRELGISEKRIILSVGQFIPRKGYDILLKACRKVDSSVGVYIIGGKPLPEYISFLNDFDLKNIHFIEFKIKEELKKYYMMADVFVLPTREDIWGLVINEAMAVGLPVITTQNCVAGIELIKDGENGYLVPVNDELLLSDKINDILHDKGLAKQMAMNNLEKIQNYTLEQMAKRHFDLFKATLGG